MCNFLLIFELRRVCVQWVFMGDCEAWGVVQRKEVQFVFWNGKRVKWGQVHWLHFGLDGALSGRPGCSGQIEMRWMHEWETLNCVDCEWTRAMRKGSQGQLIVFLECKRKATGWAAMWDKLVSHQFVYTVVEAHSCSHDFTIGDWVWRHHSYLRGMGK